MNYLNESGLSYLIQKIKTLLNAKATTNTYTTIIQNTSWNGTVAPYTKEITVMGILESDNPIIDVMQTGTYSTDKEMLNNWGKITRITTTNDKIIVYADEIPSVNIPIQIKIVK